MTNSKIKCFVCKKNSWSKLYSNLVKCKNCGFVRASNKFFNIKPNNLYDLNYFSGRDYGDYQEEQNALQLNFKDRLRKILEYKKRGKLLEIGCAFGYFITQAEKKFDTSGIDLNKDVTKIAKKVAKKSKIFTGDFLKTKFINSSKDLICMFDVIEHLKRPHKYIKRISKILDKDGILVIETGDIDSLLAKLQKSKWRLITPPTHLSYFSRKTLTTLLTKNGFEILSTNYVPFYRSIKQTVYRLTRNKYLTSLFDKINFTFPVNTFDLIFVIAQKRNTGRR